MAGRIRTIKPEILEDERSAGLSSDAWRLWVSMWLLADDFGRVRGEPRRIAASVFWACPGPVDASGLLVELEAAGCIKRYIVRGQQYAEVQNWAKHQRIDNASERNRLPAPDDPDAEGFAAVLRESPRVAAVRGSEGIGKGEEGKGEDRGVSLRSPRPIPQQQVLAVQDPPKHRTGGSSPKQQSEMQALIAHYCDRWVETHRPEDGKSPDIGAAEIKAAKKLLTHGLDAAKAYVDRFVSDPDRLMVERGHMLRDIGMRMNAYRTTAALAKKGGYQQPMPHATETKIEEF